MARGHRRHHLTLDGDVPFLGHQDLAKPGNWLQMILGAFALFIALGIGLWGALWVKGEWDKRVLPSNAQTMTVDEMVHAALTG